MAKKTIYLDHASSTPMDPVVAGVFSNALELYANPSGLHEEGIFARQKIESARKEIAKLINARSAEIIFTSSGTESNNLALRGICRSFKNPHIVTTNIEHPSIIETCHALSEEGIEVTFVPVEPSGLIDPKKIKDALKPNTCLVSVAMANNEIGTIEPLDEISKIIRHWRARQNTQTPYFHTDAVQAINYLEINVEKLGVDLLTFNGSKIYGPRGIGALYKKTNIPLKPILFGGGQEKNLRPGTENTPAILGLAKALEIAILGREKEAARLTKLREYFFSELEKLNLKTIINGDRKMRLPNNVNVSIGDLTGDIMVIELSAKGVTASSKSACKEGIDSESYVINALGQAGKNSLRFSLGRSTTKASVDAAISALKDIFAKYVKIKR